MSGNDLRNIPDSVRRWAAKYPLLTWYLVATLVYAVATFYYMGGVFVHCSTQLIGGPGDQTAGLIWLNSVSHLNPFWGFAHATNFPLGEQLASPVQASGALEYVVYWLLALVSGSVCGYNLLNALGFVSGALVMFGFIFWLTKKPWIALLAGYAVSFTPYLQIKTEVHPSYVLQGLLIGIIWIFFAYWLNPTRLLAMCCAVLAAAAFYIDPYFVLLTGVLSISLLAAGIVYNLYARAPWAQAKRQFTQILQALGLFILLLAPLVFVRVHYARQIDSYVTSSRNPIKFDAQIYGARPFEYFRPVETQPVLKALIPNFAKYRDHHISNPAEYTINLSLTLVLVTVAGLGYWIVKGLMTHKLEIIPLGVSPPLVVLALVSVGLAAFLLSLAPITLGHRMPSWYLTNYMTMWRVFARLSVLVNIALVALSAISLVYLGSLTNAKRVRTVLFVLVALGVVFEYQTFSLIRPLWSYTNDVPQIYSRLHNRPDITTIAEYSLDEQPVTMMPTFYLTYQRIHGKKLLNSALPDSPQGPMRSSIRDLSDPQTLPALRELGIDAIMVHGNDQPVGNAQLKLIDYQQGPNAKANPRVGAPASFYPIGLYRVLPGPTTDYVVAPFTGFVYPKMLSPISYDYVAGSGATVSLIGLPGHAQSGASTACFNIRSESGKIEQVMMYQGGKQVWSGTLGLEWARVRIPAVLEAPITVKDDTSDKTSLVFDKLGCQQ